MNAPGRPKLLLSLLSLAVIAGLFAAVFSFFGYQTGALAKRDDVARNGALTRQLQQAVSANDALQKIHRQRNEESHSCLLANQVEILNALAQLLRRPDLVRKLAEPMIVGHPCDGLVVGIPPPPPETTTTSTTVRPHTTTTRPKSKATTTTRPTSSSSRPTTTTSKPRPTTTTTSLIPALP